MKLGQEFLEPSPRAWTESGRPKWDSEVSEAWYSVSGSDYVTSGNSPQMVVIHKGKHCPDPILSRGSGASVSSLQYRKHMVPVLKRS